MQVLQKNAQFITTDARPVDFASIIEPVILMDANDKTKHLVHHKITTLNTKHNEDDQLTKKQQITLKELRYDTFIKVLPANKGRATVIMDKPDCLRKAATLFNDSESYKWIFGNSLAFRRSSRPMAYHS